MKQIYASLIFLATAVLLLSGCSDGVPASRSGAEHENTNTSAVESVNKEWFADCIMIGDSRLRGMIAYNAVPVGADYTYDGFTAANAMREACVPDGEGLITVPQAIEKGDVFPKCCIMLGVNEAAYRSPDSFRADYEALIAAVRARNPACTVYLLAEYPVSAAFEQTSMLTVTAIQSFNQLISEISQKTGSIYIDLFTLFADETGYLPKALASDGLHMTPEATQTLLQQILKTVAP